MPRHFKNVAAYRKSMAFIHIHHVPHKHHAIVYIGGKRHKVTITPERRRKR